MRARWRSAAHENGAKYNWLRIILISLVVLFAVSLFKNISYPLFWADESMTVMHGKRVLEYGYPKVHNGKNVLYDLSHPNPTLGIDEKTDAFIGGANWGQYYIAAIGVKLAELSDDIFTKTGIIRSLFALIGLAGLAIFAFLGSQFFNSSLSKTGFLVIFASFELISVSLVLHLREARYYPLTVFLVALTILVYTRYRMLNRTRYSKFLALLPVSLFFLFVTFSPAYFILLVSIFLFETAFLVNGLFHLYRTGTRGSRPGIFSQPRTFFTPWLKGILPLFVSLIPVAPLLFFFRPFHIAKEILRAVKLHYDVDSIRIYLDNLAAIWDYFSSLDSIYLAIFLKATLLICLALKICDKRALSFDMPKTIFSHFLSLILIVYVVSIAKIPNFLYTRYFISLQSILALIIIFDLIVIYKYLSHYLSPLILRGVVTAVCAGFVLFNVSKNWTYIEGHAYELTHQYKGPLDYVIPFIKEKYKTTDNLVIATNYEETSFMYYLDAKVTVGFVGNNLEEDALIIPDIIVFRKTWGNFEKPFSIFFSLGTYSTKDFPVIDDPTNNIPELGGSSPYTHRFHTEETNDESERMKIHLRM